MSSYLIDAIRIANKYLPPKKLAHSMRVAQYALEDYDFYEYSMLNSEDIFITAILHDVVEDSDCTFEDLEYLGIPNYIITDLKYLTKNENEEYLDYIKRCACGSATSVIVKRADMKDHLLLEDTLTDKLKDKYLPALPYIL